jgi:hypothetical protein
MRLGGRAARDGSLIYPSWGGAWVLPACSRYFTESLSWVPRGVWAAGWASIDTPSAGKQIIHMLPCAHPSNAHPWNPGPPGDPGGDPLGEAPDNPLGESLGGFGMVLQRFCKLFGWFLGGLSLIFGPTNDGKNHGKS